VGKSIQKLASVTRVGFDLAKRVFQVHVVGANGEIVVAFKLDFFSELSPVCGRNETVPVGPSLGAAIADAWLRSEADPARACEALRAA
jgi:hypothetical protein